MFSSIVPPARYGCWNTTLVKARRAARSRARRVVPLYGHPEGGQGGVPVDGDVMSTHVPEGAVIGDLQQHRDHQVISVQVERPLVLLTHPGDRNRCVEATRERDADLFADGKGCENLCHAF